MLKKKTDTHRRTTEQTWKHGVVWWGRIFCVSGLWSLLEKLQKDYLSPTVTISVTNPSSHHLLDHCIPCGLTVSPVRQRVKMGTNAPKNPLKVQFNPGCLLVPLRCNGTNSK